jgi:hypothetical protein
MVTYVKVFAGHFRVGGSYCTSALLSGMDLFRNSKVLKPVAAFFDDLRWWLLTAIKTVYGMAIFKHYSFKPWWNEPF